MKKILIIIIVLLFNTGNHFAYSQTIIIEPYDEVVDVGSNSVTTYYHAEIQGATIARDRAFNFVQKNKLDSWSITCLKIEPNNDFTYMSRFTFEKNGIDCTVDFYSTTDNPKVINVKFIFMNKDNTKVSVKIREFYKSTVQYFWSGK